MLGWLKRQSKSTASPTPAAEDFDALIGRGNRLLQEGKLAEAATGYRQAVALQPGNATAHVNLGYALLELGQTGAAEQSLKEAVRLDDMNADAHFMLGSIFRAQGKLDPAAAHFRRAIAARPEFELVYGELCQSLFQLGDLDAALETLQQGVLRFPDSPDLRCFQGNLHVAAKSYDLALACYDKALALNPGLAEAHSGQALARRGLGQLDEAILSCKRAISLDQGFADAHYNLGLVFGDLRRHEDAATHFRLALSARPEFPQAWNDLAVALKLQGRLSEAAECCRLALQAQPEFVEALCNMGTILQEQGNLEDAARWYGQALSLQPESVQARNNLACVQQEQGYIDEAVENFRHAAVLQPENVEIHNSLGCALQAQGCLDEAIGCFRHALSIEPDFDKALGNLLLTMSYHSGYSAEHYLAEARRYGALLTAKAGRGPDCPPVAAAYAPPPLRVGLVSGDLRNHPVGYFLENVIPHLDASLIELFAYSTHPLENELTARIKPRFSKWRSIAGLADEKAAALIRQDGIHMLIDLAGHTAHNRLPVFAWRPAPVQVSWLGYFASTGVAEIDFLLADPLSVPESHRQHFTETIWYLPDSRLCPSPPGEDAAIAPLPARHSGHITFGCFQNLTKLNDEVLETWGHIFESITDCRLRIQSKQLNSMAMREEFLHRLGRVGISGERADLRGQTSREAYLAAHAEVDIILDTFPYPGGTTTCDALWMGVPTLTLMGDTLLSRQGASLLACAGLPDWIAEGRDDYVALAVRKASDIASLGKLRESLRGEILNSPLFDGARFARRLEQALSGMWQHKMGPAASGV